MEFLSGPTSLSFCLSFEEGALHLSYCYFRMGLGHMEDDIDITHFFQAHYVTAYISLNCWFQCLYKLLNHCWPLMFICGKSQLLQGVQVADLTQDLDHQHPASYFVFILLNLRMVWFQPALLFWWNPFMVPPANSYVLTWMNTSGLLKQDIMQYWNIQIKWS